VDLKRARLGEGFAALLARKCFLSGMDYLVSLQVTLYEKGFFASTTFMMFFTSMNPFHVFWHITPPSSLEVTLIAVEFSPLMLRLFV
jgi:hypothetical protein